MHEFKNLDTKQLRDKQQYYTFGRICTKCNLMVLKITPNGADYFYINHIEIYNNIQLIENLNLTCEEVIIKSIIE